MTGLETNVFPILNLSELVTTYVLCKIRGLNPEQPEYYQNRQALIRKLSFSLRSPATIIERDEEPWLVLPGNVTPPPSPYPLVRTSVYFDPPTEERVIDFSTREPANDEIGRRFLQFLLQQPLTTNPRLWQPGAGLPFYERNTAEHIGPLLRYRGFSCRIVPTIEAGLALSVDVAHKVLASRPLSDSHDSRAVPKLARTALHLSIWLPMVRNSPDSVLCTYSFRGAVSGKWQGMESLGIHRREI